MKKLLLFLLVFLSQASLADLYKCSTTADTVYQDKPCQTGHSQVVMEPIPYKAKPQPAARNNTLQVERDAHGRIKRSEQAKDDFKEVNPCPANGKRAGSCPGYVIDHVQPLACGGADRPENMQWQTIAAGKEKDGWERDNCRTPAKPSAQTQRPFSHTATPRYVKTPETQAVYTGRRGGRYVLSRTGKKRYLGHNY